MEIRTVEDCFRLRLLRKIPSDLDKSRKSMELSKQSIKEAEESLKCSIVKYVIISSYMAMFHAARAILYRDGIQEKNHYAVYIYLKEKYFDKINLGIINLLNIHRIQRHEANYGLDYIPTREDALQSINDAKLFVQEVGKLAK